MRIAKWYQEHAICILRKADTVVETSNNHQNFSGTNFKIRLEKQVY